MNLPYTNQAKRVVRSFARIPAPNYPNSSSDDVWDAYYHFLQDVYHLKDWIINDDAVKIGLNKDEKKKILNNFIEGDINMKLLQAVVTNMKHLKADANHIAFKEISLSWQNNGGLKPSPEITYDDLVFEVDNNGNFVLEDDGNNMKVEIKKKSIHPKKLGIKILIAWNVFFKNFKLEGGFQIIDSWDKYLK